MPEVTIYGGPMYSGKSTALLGKLVSYRKHKKKVRAYKPEADIRDAAIKSKAFETPRGYKDPKNCRTIDLLERIDARRLARYGVTAIFLEEWHMFNYTAPPNPELIEDLYLPTMAKWGQAGIREVFAAGLDVAASGNMFDLYRDAKRYGARILDFTSMCSVPKDDGSGGLCNEEARNTQIFRKADGVPYDRSTLPDLLPELLMSEVDYRPACPEHFLFPEQTVPLVSKI